MSQLQRESLHRLWLHRQSGMHGLLPLAGARNLFDTPHGPRSGTSAPRRSAAGCLLIAVCSMTTARKYELFEQELLNPLRGRKLTREEELVAGMILNASAAQPIGIKRLGRLLREAGSPASEREVKDIVRTLRKKHELPILSRRMKGGGLWWCENEEQMKEYVKHASKQPLDELHTLSRIVKANYPRLVGQLHLEDAAQTSDEC